VYRLPRSAGGADLDGANLRYGGDAAYGDDAREVALQVIFPSRALACISPTLSVVAFRTDTLCLGLVLHNAGQVAVALRRVVRVALDDAISVLSLFADPPFPAAPSSPGQRHSGHFRCPDHALNCDYLHLVDTHACRPGASRPE